MPLINKNKIILTLFYKIVFNLRKKSMINYKTYILIVILLYISTNISFAQKRVKLFNGKDLKGWHTLPGGKWEVNRGVIKGISDKNDKNHGLLVSDKSFKDFTISIDYKAIKGNSGLYFRVEEVGGEVGVNGFQAEIDAQKDVGGLYETGGRAWVVKPNPEDIKKYYKFGEWNHMEVTAKGNNVIVWVNGTKTAELKNDTGRLIGKIALQLHAGMDMEVYFKNIIIEEL